MLKKLSLVLTVISLISFSFITNVQAFEYLLGYEDLSELEQYIEEYSENTDMYSEYSDVYQESTDVNLESTDTYQESTDAYLDNVDTEQYDTELEQETVNIDQNYIEIEQDNLDDIYLENRKKVIDEADILSATEEESLSIELDRIKEENNIEIVILTVDSIGYETSLNYAENYYDNNRYGCGESKDGFILLLSMEERDWAFVAQGKCLDIFPDNSRNKIMDKGLPKISNGKYYEGFKAIIKECDKYIEKYENDKPIVDEDYVEDSKFNIQYILNKENLLTVGGILIVSIFLVNMMKADLQTAKPNKDANQYIVKGSLDITRMQDIFITKRVTKTAKSNSSSGGGSSGSSRSSSSRGSSGKF